MSAPNVAAWLTRARRESPESALTDGAADVAHGPEPLFMLFAANDPFEPKLTKANTLMKVGKATQTCHQRLELKKEPLRR